MLKIMLASVLSFVRTICRPAFLVCFVWFAFTATANSAANDKEIIRGFNLTVFGAEYAPFGIQSRYIRKFRGTVRFYVESTSKKNRTARIKRFILGLNGKIKGLRTEIVRSKGSANFIVYAVDRKDYVDVVRTKIYRRPTASAPGKCLVRSVFSRRGIIRSDAVVVSDGGERLFKRCMIEEILQGLGPLNEHPSLYKSVFNDLSRQTSFTRFDRLILNMLYDPRIKIGASIDSIQSLLPTILADAKRKIR